MNAQLRTSHQYAYRIRNIQDQFRTSASVETDRSIRPDRSEPRILPRGIGSAYYQSSTAACSNRVAVVQPSGISPMIADVSGEMRRVGPPSIRRLEIGS